MQAPCPSTHWCWYEGCFPPEHSPHALLGLGVHAGGGFIQQRDARAAQHAQGKAELRGRKGRGEDTTPPARSPVAALGALPYLAFQPHAQLLRCLLQVVLKIQGT